MFVWELEKLSSSQDNLLLILFVMELENYLHVLQLDTSLPFFLLLRELLKVVMSGDPCEMDFGIPRYS